VGSLPIFVHVAYVRGSVLRHVDDRPHRLSAGRGNGRAHRGRSVIYDRLVFFDFSFFITLFVVFLVPSARLSWLFVGFWFHVNTVYRIVSYRIVSEKVNSADARQSRRVQ